MFDSIRGTLTFDEPAAVIAPSLRRDEFLRGSLAEGATTHVENEPYHSWKLRGTFRSAGRDLLVVLWFREQQLTMVSLTDSDPRFGTSWGDYSLEKEMSRKASHDDWLSRALGRRRKFSWGRVWSDYDERGGSSDMGVKYAAGE